MSKPKKAVNSPTGKSASPQRLNPIYPKPTVPVALGEFLSPKQVTAAGLEVVVTYPSIKKGDVIALTFNDVDTFVPIIVVENQTSVSFWISVPHIIRALETTVDIHYTLSGQSGGQRSDIFQLTVLPFMEGDIKMPEVIQATDGTLGELDLSKFTGDAEIVIKPWPLISEGQKVWLDITDGTNPLPIFNEHSVVADEVTDGISSPISRTYLERIPDQKVISFPGRLQLKEDIICELPLLELKLVDPSKREYTENFSKYSLGNLTEPEFKTTYIDFVFGNLPRLIEEVDDNKVLAFDINGVSRVKATFKDIDYTYIAFDCTVFDSMCSIGCDAQIPSNQTLAAGIHKRVEFSGHGVIKSLSFSPYYTGDRLTVAIDNITLRINAEALEKKKLSADEQASASSDTSPPRATAPQDPAYPAPTVEEASNNVLSPLDVRPGGIHVKVTYESMSSSDTIGLKFNGEDTFQPQYGNDEKTVVFTVGSTYVAKALDKDIVVEYVISGGDGRITSESLMLKILPLMEGDMTMIKIPQATESTPGKLDLSTFTGDAEFIIPPCPLIDEKQLVWMDMDSESSTQHLLEKYSVTSDDVTAGVTGSISRAVLENILVTKPEGTLLEFAAKVQLKDNGSADGAHPFPALKLLLQHNSGESGDVVEGFEAYESGDKPSPWGAQNMTFTGQNMRIYNSTDGTGRAFKAVLKEGEEELFVKFNGSFKTATVDLAATGGIAIFRCIYGNELVDEKRVHLDTWNRFTFSHDQINAFKVVSETASVNFEMDNIMLYK